MDVISLRGLRLVGVHGVLDEERNRAQPFEVDIDIEADLHTAGDTDALQDTLDYGAITALAAAVVESESHALLERIAARIAADVLAFDGRVVAVTVDVWKLRPPVAFQLDRAGVRVHRRR
jgi:dihydroneopterin aldolase